MESNHPPVYPLLEAMPHIKGAPLKAMYTNRDVAALFETSIRTIQYRVAEGNVSRWRPAFSSHLLSPASTCGCS